MKTLQMQYVRMTLTAFELFEKLGHPAPEIGGGCLTHMRIIKGSQKIDLSPQENLYIEYRASESGEPSKSETELLLEVGDDD